MKILVVDDESHICDMLERYLSLEGHIVTTCSNPLDVPELLKGNIYQVAILDIVMPGMSGLDLIPMIKKSNGLTQVFMITGYVTVENILTAFERGATNCFFKPFNSLEEINEEIKNGATHIQRIYDVLKALRSQNREDEKYPNNVKSLNTP